MIRFFGIKVLSYPERSRTTLSEHMAIFEGINEKNVEAAKEAMDYHMLKTREAILKRTKNKYD
jgi:DNA-binding GntR family transcriptional regulator